MCKLKCRVVSLLMLTYVCYVNTSDVFHVYSRNTFHPDEVADYFGYSVVLSEMGFYVGAPKAKSRSVNGSSPGSVFACPLSNPDIRNVTCHPLERNGPQSLIKPEFFKHDMWFGASMVAAADDNLLVCAPRYIEPFDDKLLANGACFVYEKDFEYRLLSLDDNERPAFTTEGGRKDYGEYDGAFNYYAYGQAGMSVAYTKDDHLIIGAPGVLQWTGAVLDYKKTSINFKSLPSANPAYTKDLGPDDYFGYTVESGVFETNGSTLHIVAVPRSKMGYGQVLIFKPTTNERDPLNIKAKLRGPQLGAYFGAALCALDLNGDGISDLLVGAPNFAARSDGQLTYDQGAVFVYMTRKKDSGFILEDSGFVGGSGESGARFGTAIAELGDIDGDGMTDVAVGAPYENEGAGVVYIYKGSTKGLIRHPYQRINADGARGFGMSIARGFDVDHNGCNDLAIGAHNSGTAYVYRCVPTIMARAFIKLPNAKNLARNASSFNAAFCIAVTQGIGSEFQIELNATSVSEDPEGNMKRWDKVITIRPGKKEFCDKQTIEIDNRWNFSRPIRLVYELKPTVELDSLIKFPGKRARLSESSVLISSLPIHLLSDCGDDLICTPWLEMTLDPLGKTSSYVPGIDSKFGAKITITNLEEPAHGVKLHLVLPCPPKRLPISCSLQNLDMICDLPEPLNRNETVDWEIELEYTWNGTASELSVQATLEDPLYQRNVSKGAQELVLKISPHSDYGYFGKSQSNSTIQVSRETFNRSGDVFFTHYYEFTNYGPSDLYNLKIEFLLSEGMTLVGILEGATQDDRKWLLPTFMLPANTTAAYTLPLRFDLVQYGKTFEDIGIWNLTTSMIFNAQYGSFTDYGTIEVATTLILEPKTPIWPLIVGLLVGLIVLAGIILALYKFGFFSRNNLEEMKANDPIQEPSASQALL